MQWWCSRDSDSSRWIELFALLKIVERRRSWWGWWLNLLSSYSGSFVSRWRRLQARLLCLSLSLFLSRSNTLSLPSYLFVFSLFLSLSFSHSFFLSAGKFSQLRQHEESTWAQKAPEYLCHGKVEESRDLDCVPQAVSSLRSNVRNFCFSNSWIEAKADRHFLIRILLLFCIFGIRDRSLVSPFIFFSL